MKKLLLTLCMALMTMSASARYFSEPSLQGENAVGAHLLYGTEVPNFGLGVRYQRFIIDHVRVEGVFDYLIKNKELSMWDINLNGHYVWNIGEHVRLYPLVGVCFASWKEHITNDHDNRVGLNLGAGLQVALGNNWWVGAEAKVQEMRHYSQGVFDVNISYCF
ncbi:MAG: porin family protein [Bacteroidaceae bacterium]|nr:porin family protein [Bacteroidaceae bacterium]